MTLKVIHRLQVFSDAIRRSFVQQFTRFQLTLCSHGPSALAELLFVHAMHDILNSLERVSLIIDYTIKHENGEIVCEKLQLRVK